MNRFALIFAISATVCLVVCIGCSDETSTDPIGGISGEGQFTLKLIDSAGPYDEVNIEFIEVSVHRAGDDSTSGWQIVSSDTLWANLLEYTNGNYAILADSSLAAGEYTQVRLLLTENNNVVVDGIEHSLEIPSGSTNGLKLNHIFTLEDGGTFSATLDFDAERSIHMTGNGTYKMNPVIRMIVDGTSGTIFGNIDPVAAFAQIMAFHGDDTVKTYADTLSGDFRLMALPSGQYDVEIMGTAGSWNDTTITGVQVSIGQETDMGVIYLEEAPTP